MIVRDVPDIDLVRAGIRHHHERWDGDGYLDRLAGEEIPLIARILAVGDAFSAMTTTRPYRKALDLREALTRLEDAAGTQLDEAWSRRSSRGSRPTPTRRCRASTSRRGAVDAEARRVIRPAVARPPCALPVRRGRRDPGRRGRAGPRRSARRANPDASRSSTTRSRRRRAAPGVLANDVVLLGTTAILDTDLRHGTLQLAADGGYHYDPDPGFVGTDSFTYHDSGPDPRRTPATVTIHVTNAAPVARRRRYARDDRSHAERSGAGRPRQRHGRRRRQPDGDPRRRRRQRFAARSSPTARSRSSPAARSPARGPSRTGSATASRRRRSRRSRSTSSRRRRRRRHRRRDTGTRRPVPTPVPTPARPRARRFRCPRCRCRRSRSRPCRCRPSVADARRHARPTRRPRRRREHRRHRADRDTVPHDRRPRAGSDGPGAAPGRTRRPTASAPTGAGTGRIGWLRSRAGRWRHRRGRRHDAARSRSTASSILNVVGVDGLIEWAVPSLVLSVPGLLLILAVLAQALVGSLWIPVIRRWLGAFGVRRHRSAGRAAG